MRVAVIILVVQALVGKPALCQKDIVDSIPVRTVLIRFNPFGLLDVVDENLSAGVEYRFHHRWSAAADVSWIFNSVEYSRAEHTAGISLRPSVRYFVGYRKRTFLEAEGQYKHVTYRLKDWLGHDCVDGKPGYQQLTDFTFHKAVYGFHFKIGLLQPIERSRFAVELYAGAGLHFSNSGVDDHAGCCYLPPRGDFSAHNRDRTTYLALPVGFRIMYRANNLPYH